jgi:hypothetical protein
MLKDEKPPKIVRPNSQQKMMTFLWTPGVELAELVYRDGKVMYAVWDGKEVKYPPNYNGNLPPSWIANVVAKRTLQLPSEPKPFGTIDELAKDMKDFIHRYFECSEVMESVAVLYVLQTWVYERFQAVPYLRLLGSYGTGKSRGTETIGNLCYRPISMSGSSSSAVLYRIIEVVGGTLLLDEADYSKTELGAEVAKILNAGYQQNSPVWRNEKDSTGNFVPTAFDVFGPKIISGRKAFRDEATESRCLTYRPQRQTRRDIPLQLPDSFATEAQEIRNRLLDWRLRNFERLAVRDASGVGRFLSEEFGTTLQPRTLQLMSPLLSIAVEMGEGAKYIRHLIQFSVGYEGERREVLSTSVDASLVRAFLSLRKNIQPTCLDIARYVRTSEGEEDMPLLRWLNPRKVSEMLHEMGFRTIRSKRGAVVSIDEHKLNALCQKYGIDLLDAEATVVVKGALKPAGGQHR